MATDRSYLEYILDQLSDLEDISWRPMMGEYVIYYQGKVIGDICDNRFLLKPTPTVCAVRAEAPLEAPYSGAKAMVLVDPDEREKLTQSIRLMFGELPFRKKTPKKR